MKKFNYFLLAISIVLISGCLSRIDDINNICQLLENNRSWYKAVSKASSKWAVPKQTLLAFIHQESKFKARAKPPRKKLFGLIPTFRPSSAYGYPQALDTTWKDYRKSTGRRFASRDDFDDAVDFIGWYMDRSRQRLNIPASNVRAHYLAYHEGPTGYAQGTYKNKKWLVAVAEKVEARSQSYATQLNQCEKALSRKRLLFF